MKFVNSLGRKRLTLAALLLACVGLAGLGIWRSAAFQQTKQPAPSVSGDELKGYARASLQRGVGDQVRFATATDSAESVQASVESADNFILERTNLSMSAETKIRLVKAEQDVLRGNGRRLSVEELTDTLTEIVLNRVATLNNADIEWAANVYQPNSGGQITARANGKWGYLTTEQFSSQVRAGRQWSGRGNVALKTSLRSMIDGEVQARVNALATTLPEKFGNLHREGATPVQALLISYSLAADDPLESSQSELRSQLIQRRMIEGQTRPAHLRRDSGKPYGVNGFVYSSPVNLFFDRAAIGQLLARAEGGTK